MQKQNPLLRIWGWGKDEHGGLIFAIVSALIGVALGMLPYFAAAQIIIALLGGNREWTFYLSWCAAGLIGYALRACLYAPGPSAARDDRQLVWPGVHSDLSVRAGLAYGAAGAGLHPPWGCCL